MVLGGGCISCSTLGFHDVSQNHPQRKLRICKRDCLAVSAIFKRKVTVSSVMSTNYYSSIKVSISIQYSWWSNKFDQSDECGEECVTLC